MFRKEINMVDVLISKNKAYSIDVPNKGTYICMTNDNNKTRFIAHEDVITAKKNDYVIWVPNSTHGVPSPWGQGLPSANLYVLVMNSR